MINPQKENGYVAIANEIWDALARIRINGEARQVLDVILRKTYGWNKKEDAISLSQFCLTTGLKRIAVCKAIKKLLFINIITQKDTSTINIYAFNKHYDTWKPLPKKIPPSNQKDTPVPKKVMSGKVLGNRVVPKRIHTKDTLTKPLIQKTIIPKGLGAKPQKGENVSDISEYDPDIANDTSIIPKKSFGNPLVAGAIEAITDHLGGKPDGTMVSERRYAKHLTDALKKEYPDQDPIELIRQLLRASLADQWIAKNCTSLRWLYYNKQKILQTLKFNQGKVIKIS